MKGSGGATRTFRPQQRQVALRELTDCLLDAYDFISQRAYEKYLDRGGAVDAESGALREDWLRAESEILGRLDVHIENARDYISALVTLPGFTATDVEVGIESRWLVILGSRKMSAKNVRGGETPDAAQSHERSRAWQRIEYLPEPVTDIYVRPGAENDCAGSASNAPENSTGQIFSVIELPAEVDPGRSRAVMASGLLGVRMFKKDFQAR